MKNQLIDSLCMSMTEERLQRDCREIAHGAEIFLIKTNGVFLSASAQKCGVAETMQKESVKLWSLKSVLCSTNHFAECAGSTTAGGTP
jgi:hypothetical protein